jgi:hypothetical protein
MITAIKNPDKNICPQTGRPCSWWRNVCIHPDCNSPTLFCKRMVKVDYADDSLQLRESGAEPFLGMDEE